MAALTTLFCTNPTTAQTMEARAKAAAESSRARTSSSEALHQNFLTPGLSGGALVTIDGKTSFTPSIGCRKSKTYLEALIQPAATGDIARVQVGRDRDMDGRIESATVFEGPISGICTNGVIMCQPVSWAGCRHFLWSVTGGNLSLASAEMSDLSGCYCVNGSCGSGLVMANLASVLIDLGGGMVAALTTQDPRIGVSEAEVDGPLIRYVGAETTACSGATALPQTAYATQPVRIDSDARSASTSSSIFQAITGSPIGQGRTEIIRSCKIGRQIEVKSWTIDDAVAASGQFMGVTSCGSNCRRYKIGGDGDCSDSPPIYAARFEALEQTRVISAAIVEMGADDWVQARIDDRIVGSAGKRPWLHPGIPSGDCRIDGNPWRNYDRIDFTDALKKGATTVAARVRGGGRRDGYVTVEIVTNNDCETQEQLTDQCAGLAADSQCRLAQEDVDGVVTVRNSVHTGLSPLPQTRLFGTGACTMSLTRPFFERQRSYRCVADPQSVPKPDLSRAAWILDHSTETMIADRVRQPDGSYATSTRGFAMPARTSVSACEPICKTRAARASNQAAISGVTGSQLNDPSGFDTFYHACTADDRCPAGPGEQVVSACGCLDDFPEAVVMMQAMRIAGADLACTAEDRK